ncbi:MAG: hypothetical protein Q7Q71_13955 [Verrucomicrobiota bacterium JB023]|nr:hypothetical protein [Verrucomicrobiota bacterium JB023]
MNTITDTGNVLVTATALAFSPMALGEILLYEGFDYTEGETIYSLDATGTGWDGNWSGVSGDNRGEPTVGAGLSLGSLTGVGGAYIRPQRYGVAMSSRTIATEAQTALTADDSTIYFSVLLDATHGLTGGPGYAKNSNGAIIIGDSGFDDGVNPGSTPPGILEGGNGVGVAFYGADGTGFDFSNAALIGVTYADGARTTDTETPAVFGDNVVLVIGKIEWAASGTNDVLTLYALTEVDSGLPEPFSVMEGDWDQSTFNVVAIGQGQTEVFDEITFGTSLSDVLPTPSSSTVLEITATDSGYDFSWNSTVGTIYDLVSSTDLSTEPSTWAIYDDGNTVYEDILFSETGTNSLSGVVSTDEKRFFALSEEKLPPVAIFETDFETDNGGFVAANLGTGDIWEYGTPASSGFGGTVNSGAGAAEGTGSCWGTDIGTSGFYSAGTSTTLTSPVIDLSSYSEGTVSFDEALDLEGADTAELYIIDGTTEDVIGSGAIYVATDSVLSTADWEEVSVDLPSEAFGQSIRLQFRLSGSGGETEDYMGWYIDNVLVEGL